jgi:hypothetical protein
MDYQKAVFGYQPTVDKSFFSRCSKQYCDRVYPELRESVSISSMDVTSHSGLTVWLEVLLSASLGGLQTPQTGARERFSSQNVRVSSSKRLSTSRLRLSGRVSTYRQKKRKSTRGIQASTVLRSRGISESARRVHQF